MSSFDKKHDTCIVTGRYLQCIHIPSIHHQELEGFLKKYNILLALDYSNRTFQDTLNFICKVENCF